MICAASFGDCDNNSNNGCEKALSADINNCGACGKVCGAVPNGMPGCMNGACTVSCAANMADCDKNPANGCEANLQTDAGNCGACGMACGGNISCVAGKCAAYGDWLVNSSCNGVDFGGGCTAIETGYHYKGAYGGYQCWWHTKNQAWNTTVNTNIYQLAIRFNLNPATGREQWCDAFANTPNPGGYAVNANYNSQQNIGAWGWCGGAPFASGGWVCLQ